MTMRDFLGRLVSGTIYGGGPSGPTPLPFSTAGPRRQARPSLGDLPPEVIMQILMARDPNSPYMPNRDIRPFANDPISSNPPPTFRDRGMLASNLPLDDIFMLPRPSPGQFFPEPRLTVPIPRRFSRGSRDF